MRINHITTMTDMSRVIVNSGHPVAKLSFNDERHYNVHAQIGKKKREEKKDKSHLSRIVPLHTRKRFHCLHMTTKTRRLMNLFILRNLSCNVYVPTLPRLFLSLFVDCTIIICTNYYMYKIIIIEKIWLARIATREEEITEIQRELSSAKLHDLSAHSTKRNPKRIQFPSARRGRHVGNDAGAAHRNTAAEINHSNK